MARSTVHYADTTTNNLLKRLHNKLLPHTADRATDLWGATILSTYAIVTRYPGKDKVTKKEAERAAALADKVRKTVVKALAQEGLKITLRTKT